MVIALIVLAMGHRHPKSENQQTTILQLVTNYKLRGKYYMEALYEGDCIEIMQTLPSERVDMIFADPPFNVGKKYGGKADSDKRSDYFEWCASWIKEEFRLLKSNRIKFFDPMKDSHSSFTPKLSLHFLQSLHGRGPAVSLDRERSQQRVKQVLSYGRVKGRWLPQ